MVFFGQYSLYEKDSHFSPQNEEAQYEQLILGPFTPLKNNSHLL